MAAWIILGLVFVTALVLGLSFGLRGLLIAPVALCAVLASMAGGLEGLPELEIWLVIAGVAVLGASVGVLLLAVRDARRRASDST